MFLPKPSLEGFEFKMNHFILQLPWQVFTCKSLLFLLGRKNTATDFFYNLFTLKLSKNYKVAVLILYRLILVKASDIARYSVYLIIGHFLGNIGHHAI